MAAGWLLSPAGRRVGALASSTSFTISPSVVADNVTDYGAGFSFNAATGSATQAAGTTLVLSPITAACASCHDSSLAINHMTANGGEFYAPRASVLALGALQEQCLPCHGPGRIAAIGEVHQRQGCILRQRPRA